MLCDLDPAHAETAAAILTIILRTRSLRIGDGEREALTSVLSSIESAIADELAAPALRAEYLQER